MFVNNLHWCFLKGNCKEENGGCVFVIDRRSRHQTSRISISDGVNLISINQLVDINTPWEKYVVIGAGKTGLDALLYLIDHNVNPDRIIWIVSNDCWYVNRDLLGDGLIHIGNVLPLCINAVLGIRRRN